MTGFSRRVRDQIMARANGACERCGITAQAYQLHHRRPRGMGGSSADDTNQASNGLCVCVTCHSEIEANREESLRFGWLVRQGQAPDAVKVLRKGTWVVLNDEGGTR